MPRYLYQTKRVQADWWDDDEWVEVKKLSGAERERLQGRLFHIGGRAHTLDNIENTDDEVWKVMVGEAEIATIEVGVNDWNLYYADSETEQRHKLPFNKRSIEALPPDDFDFIVQSVREFNAEGPADDPKSETGRGAGGATEGAVAGGDGADPHHAQDAMELA